MPGTAPEISEACQPIMRVEAAVAHSERYAAHKDDYRANIKALIEAGLATDSDAYARARDFVRRLRGAMSERLDTVDALLLPTAPGTAPASLETTGPGIFCGPASFTGLPAISLPSGVAPSGLPLSIQLIGPHLGEVEAPQHRRLGRIRPQLPRPPRSMTRRSLIAPTAIVFDFDLTIADSRPGFIAGHTYAAQQTGVRRPRRRHHRALHRHAPRHLCPPSLPRTRPHDDHRVHPALSRQSRRGHGRPHHHAARRRRHSALLA